MDGLDDIDDKSFWHILHLRFVDNLGCSVKLNAQRWRPDGDAIHWAWLHNSKRRGNYLHNFCVAAVHCLRFHLDFPLEFWNLSFSWRALFMSGSCWFCTWNVKLTGLETWAPSNLRNMVAWAKSDAPFKSRAKSVLTALLCLCATRFTTMWKTTSWWRRKWARKTQCLFGHQRWMPYFPTMQKFVQTDEQTNKTWLALACVLLVKHLTTTLFLFVLCGATLTFTAISTKAGFVV